MATIAENVISKYSSDESVQQKVDKVRALHGLKDHREVEEVYDELAGNYDELVTSLEYCGPFFTSRTVSRIESKTDAKMLDVACGTGLVGDELHKLGYTQIVGTDLSQSSLDVLARKGSYTKSVHANFGPSTPLDFDDGYFDVAMSCGSFLPMHLNEKCLPEMIRLVRKGGYIIITTRKYIFEGETGDMKLRPGLIKLTQEGALTKMAHEENLYEKDGDDHVTGITLVYQVI
ncbi:methyltransferase-like protein 27 isoform X1 [Strongylocentrotus purpuratus]|uniref:Methyltransferase type 11 domain-containing protein n=1 Tax=Strongylocentrotus purpuratus TaxID=7668 RepID=A0A7M7SZR2_STRPU|nr:methyltransferase-like protein 27 isoform X1 [Strongylocentrotus purpuratus]